ncbi:hypothetical protein [Halobacteriovorax sp. RT-2-5]|uniref:hypothetical protein n=1 Tax=unclassified Halobacteriovorax TaxID=2639665 RepID=UPI00399AF4A5
MKTLLQSLQKLSIKSIILGSVLAGPSFFQNQILAQNTQENQTSLLETFEEKLKTFQSEINEKILNPPSDKVSFRQNFKDEEKIELSKRQLNAILLYSEQDYKELFHVNKCSIYTLLKNRLIRINNQPLLNVEASVTSDSSTSTALVPIDAFLAHYYKSNCRLSFKQSRLFEKGLLKDTFTKLTPKFPRNQTQCLDQYKDLKSNINIDHICSAPYTIELAGKLGERLRDNSLSISERSYINSLRRQSKTYTDEINDRDILYFKNFCSNLSREELFCKNYSKQDFWSLIINKQKATDHIEVRCRNILGKTTPEDKMEELDYLKCISLLRNEPSRCMTQGPATGSVLYPMPSCNEISETLKISRLKNNYNDCPRNIGNYAIINGARVIKHFATNDLKSKDCVFPSYEKIYGLYLESGEEEKWPLSICYNSNDGKKCLPFIPGNSKENYNALNMVVANALFQTKIVTSRIKCEQVSKKQFNPLRLKYKAGCWVVPQELACRSQSCKYNVMIDNRKALEIWSEGSLSFDYFKTKYNSSDADIHSRILSVLNIKEQEINSLTSLKFFLDNKKNGIIHGQGCAEDIYPSHYQLRKIGICTPMPFIIDGYKEINNNTYLSFRSALDDISSPRSVLWANAFTALSRYSTLSPLKNWELYGLY